MKAFVWEHACDVFSLLIDIFDAFVVLEVVWNSFFFFCARDFNTGSLSVSFVHVYGAQKSAQM